jgi:uncharacterized membrane protein
MEARKVEAGEGWNWVVNGWKLFVKNPVMLIAFCVVILLITIVLAFIPFIGALALMLITPALTGGVLYAIKQLDDGGQMEFGHLFQAFQDKEKTGPMLTLGALLLAAGFVIGIVMAVIVGGSMAAIMAGSGGDPGAINATGAGIAGMVGVIVILVLEVLLLMGFIYATPLVMLGGEDPIPAVKSSFFACLSNWLPLLIFGIIYVVLSFIALIPFGLGYIVLIPVMFCSLYASYRNVYG